MKSEGIRACEIMEAPEFYLKDNQTWNDALEIFYCSKIHALPVIKDNKELVGVITIQQLIEKIVHKRPLTTSFINDLDEHNCIVVEKDNIVFNSHDVDNDFICVCENKKLIGIISVKKALQMYKWQVALLSKFEELSKEYEMIFNNCYDSIYEIDAEGIVIRANPATERITGKLPDQVIGKSIYEIESARTFFPSVVPIVLKNNKTTTILQNVRGDEKAVVTGVPVYDAKGKITRIIATTRDISKLIRLIEEATDTSLLDGLYERLRKCNERTEQYCKALHKIQRESNEAKRVTTKNREMYNVLDLAKKVASVDSTVLILGESGVGKDLIATMIHNISERREKSFVKINCGAIPEGVLESELFGYEKGAFTGALREGKLGLIELANEGTIFLNEIGEMSLPLQVKLLQFVQDRNFIRVGGSTPINVDIRIIAATNKDLSKMVKEGTFREDLYYRLNVVPVMIPPLRERREDVSDLIFKFLDYFNNKYKRTKQLSSEAMEILINYDWPGNVRELENLIERLVIVSKDKIIYSDDLPVNIYKPTEQESRVNINYKEGFTLKESIEQIESVIIQEAYEKFGSTTKAAEALGVDQSTIVRKLKKYRENS